MRSSLLHFLFAFLFLVGFTGCAALSKVGGSGDSIRIEELRPTPIGRIQQEKAIDRTELVEKLRTGGSRNTVRLVEVFRRGTPPPYPEHRFFDVQPGSVYALLGLESADILVAADGYVVKDPETFWAYLNLLPKLESGSIEINRLGAPILLKYTIKNG